MILGLCKKLDIFFMFVLQNTMQRRITTIFLLYNVSYYQYHYLIEKATAYHFISWMDIYIPAIA